MERRELLDRITTFPILAAGLAEDILAGDFRSVFTGQGIEFDEVRHYERGDDVRSIDWNVSARFGTPYVKMYREEREMTVCLILDTSVSMFAAAASELSRFEQGVLAAALISFSAERMGQRLCSVFFDKEINQIFPPRKGRSHIMAFISAALRARPLDKGSDLAAALAGAGRFLKQRSLLVIISDFLSVNWEQELPDLTRRHDVIALRITDPLDLELPNMGLLPLEDGETGLRLNAPTGFHAFSRAWSEWHTDRAQAWENFCRRSGAACLELSTGEDASTVLMRFFGSRRKK